MRRSMAKSVMVRALVAVVMTLALGASCAATYYAAPQYLLGQLPVRLAVVIGGEPISAIDPNDPITVHAGQSLYYTLYYYNAAAPQHLVAQVCDMDSVGDPNEFNDNLHGWIDYDGNGIVDEETEGWYVGFFHTYFNSGLMHVHWKVKDMGVWSVPYQGTIVTGADDSPAADAPDPTNWDEEGELYLNMLPADTTPPSVLVVDDGCSTQSNNTLHACWTACDPETGILSYQYAIGTSPGGTNVVGWTYPTPSTATEVTRTGLSLVRGQTYYFSVRATNGAYITGTGYSDGIRVSEAQVPADF